MADDNLKHIGVSTPEIQELVGNIVGKSLSEAVNEGAFHYQIQVFEVSLETRILERVVFDKMMHKHRKRMIVLHTFHP